MKYLKQISWWLYLILTFPFCVVFAFFVAPLAVLLMLPDMYVGEAIEDSVYCWPKWFKQVLWIGYFQTSGYYSVDKSAFKWHWSTPSGEIRGPLEWWVFDWCKR